jgi:hypothetical protein
MAFSLIYLIQAGRLIMKYHKTLPRRTFSQDRFDILIKRQKSGKATFNELTELDEIVNRDPDIRESILLEMQEINNPDQEEDTPQPMAAKPQTWIDNIRTFINRLFFISQTDNLNAIILS